jgi:hypothetical protein
MADEQHQHRKMKQTIPPGSTADDVATMVKAILRIPFRVSDIHVSELGFIEWEFHVPKSEPPDGELMEPVPIDITELMSRVKLSELSGTKATLSFRSLAIVAQMMLAATKKRLDGGVVDGLTGAAWVVGSITSFCRWLGIKPSSPPSKFLGIPLIKDVEIPSSRLILLCARSSGSDYLEAEHGFVVAMIPKDSS